MDKNQGYAILKAVMLENGRGFALGEHPTAPSPYVTWACYDDEHGIRQYEWGHYGDDLEALEKDLLGRVREYQRLYGVEVDHIEAPAFTSIIPPSGPWTSVHSRNRPITPRMKLSTTISASPWRAARSSRGGISPTQNR